MSDVARTVLVGACQAADLTAEDLAPVLDALDRGSRSELRERGEHLLAELVRPAIDAVYAEARGASADRLTELEARRLALHQVYASLRHVGAIADVPARDPEMTAQTAARRRTAG